MAIQVGSLFVNMALESSSFISGLRRTQDETKRTESVINRSMDGISGKLKGALVGLGGALTATALIDVTKRAFDFADAIVDLSDRTGFSTKTIQEFNYAAQMAGSSVESSNGALEKFTKKLGEAQSGSKSARDSLAELGVTSYDADTALKQAADGIAKLDTKQKQVAATTDLFGKKAADLTMTMAAGSAGLNDMASKAQSLGIVMEDDLLRNAGQVNDKLDTLKMIVDAQMASAIVQNADGIASMASSIAQLGGSLAGFWSHDAQGAMAIMGAMAGFTLTPGALPMKAIGAGAGAFAGYVAGGGMQQAARQREEARFGTNAKWTAASRLEGQLSARITANKKRGGGGGMTITDAQANPQIAKDEATLKRVRATRERLEAGMRGGTVATYMPQARGGLGGLGGGDTRTLSGGGKSGGKKGGGKSGPSAEDLAKKAAELEFQFQSDLARANDELLSSRRGLATTTAERYTLDRQMLTAEQAREDAELDRDGPAGSKKLTAAQVEQLKSINANIAKNKMAVIDLEEAEEVRQAGLAVATADLTNQSDLLQLSASSARTATEKRRIELRILDLHFQQEKLALESIIASKQSTEAEKKIAQARLDLLPALKTGQTKQVERDTMGPLAKYLDAIPKTGAEIAESIEVVAVDGLDGLKSSLLDCIKGTGDLGQAFGKLKDTVINGLLDIAIQQMLIKPLGKLLFGSGEEGGGGGLLGGIIHGIAGAAVKGGKANGGMGNSGTWLVGEHGPEIIRTNGPFHVTNNSKLQGLNSGGGTGGVNVTFGSIVSNDPAAIKAAAYEAIMQVAPMIVTNAKNETIRSISRPQM